MRTLAFLTFFLAVTNTRGQTPCDNILLYDQMTIHGEQPILHKLKRFDLKLVPDSTLIKMKAEIIRVTSPDFFKGLKIKSVKLFDSAVAKAWSWTHDPITDSELNPVHFFYTMVFETKTAGGSSFMFRVDVLKNGALLNENQLAFLRNGKLEILNCTDLMKLISTDTIQPIKSVKYVAIAYSPIEETIVWTVASKADPKTGIEYLKEVDAITGTIIRRLSSDQNPPKLEEVKVLKNN